MGKNTNIVLTILLIVTGPVSGVHLRAQQQSSPNAQEPMSDCPMMKHQGMAGMNERGGQGMGFSQAKTTHHFLLKKDGGAIEVQANEAKDTESRAQIREHLQHIAMMFADGNFQIPAFVHDQYSPAGVAVMQRLKSVISYKFEATERGARVLISSNNQQAVTAIHAFLRFQITEHKTGDPQ